MNRRLRLWPGPLALLALATAVVLLVPQVVLLGKLPDHFDYWLQEYVHLAYLHRALQAGELPLWNGQLVIGTPHLADPQTAVLYPLTTLPLLVLPPEVVARLSLPLHFFIAGACTYGYGRRLGLSHLGALAAGLAYALAPHFAPLEVATYLQQSAAWAPAILWALHAGLDGARRGPFAVAGLLWALQLWRGYAQTWYLTGLLAAAYVLFHLGIRINERPRGVVTRLTGAVLFAAVGLGAGAAQLLPSFELLGISHRADGYTLAEASGPGRVTLLNLLGAAGPDAEVSGAFPGGVVLGLALAAALYARGQHVWFALGAATLSLALCLGDRTPVWALAYHTIPGFNTLHMPHRALFLWSLSLAVLAGSGLDALRRGQPVPRPFLIATGLVVALTWLGLALAPAAPAEATRGALQLAAGLGALLVCQALGHLTPLSWIAPGALTALLAFDLLAYSAPRLYGHFYPPGPVYARPPAAAWLQDRMASHLAAGQGPYRFASAVYRSPETGEGSQLQDNRRLAYLPPNIPALYPGLEAAQGYLAIRTREVGTLFDSLNDLGRNARTLSIYDPRSRLLDLLGIRYLVTDDVETFASVVGGGHSRVAVEPAVVIPVREPLPTAELEVLSSLGDAASVPDGEIVAQITALTAAGAELSFPLRAGEHTAEWLYDSPAVAGTVRHRLAPVARVQPRPDGSRAHVYRATFDLRPLGQPAISELQVRVVHPGARLNLDRMVLHTPFGSRFRLAHADGALRIWENPAAMPRVWWSGSYEVEAQTERQLERLKDPAFDLGHTALLISPPPELPPAPEGGSSAAAGAGFSRGARLLRATVNTRLVEVTAPAPGLLLISQAFDPGWRATVDGQAAPVYPANGGVQAIPVPAGTHQVSLHYLPSSVLAGAAITSITLLGLLSWGICSWQSVRAARPPEREAD